MTPASVAPIAITDRSGLDESVHHGIVVALGPSGRVEFALGDPDDTVYPRSSNKPLQAVGMVRAGLRLPPPLLALVCASHDGSPAHRDGVLAILASAGLAAEALGNTADLPLDAEARDQVIRDGGTPTPLAMNCSGKHAGMLACCVANGWAHDASYLMVDHPLQAAITATLADLVDADIAHVGVDGCGAPAHAITLRQLARGVQRIATGAAGDAGDAVVAAMTSHPDMVGGPTRDVTLLMRGLPGLVAKDGAEGVFVAASPDGRVAAIKVADGGDRARPAVMLAALRHLGFDVEHLVAALERPVRGHGRAVGRVRALF